MVRPLSGSMRLVLPQSTAAGAACCRHQTQRAGARQINYNSWLPNGGRWRMKRAMVWSIALTTLLASRQAQAQQREVGGLSVAKAVCSRCHAVEKNSPPSRDAAAPRFEDIANSPGITARAISKALQTAPHRRMPNFREKPPCSTTS